MSEDNGKVVLLEGPFTHDFPGRDVIAYKWFVNGFEVMVEISRTAYEADSEGMSERVRKAKETRGRSEIERMADWDVPNPSILLTTDSDD